MEGVHGIELGWWHRPQKEYKMRPRSLEMSGSSTNTDDGKGRRGSASAAQEAGNAAPKSTPAVLNRPHLLSRNSSQKVPQLANGGDPAGKAAGSNLAPPPSPPAGRKNSWISGLTAKFSSATPSPAAAPEAPAANSKATAERPMPIPQPRRASLPSASPPPADQLALYTPAVPKSSQSFLQNALRRFHSGSTLGAKSAGNNGVCERRVLNVDTSRDRCRVEGLNQAKLRRVAFCVDVEIAGMPTYPNDEADPADSNKNSNSGSSRKQKAKKVKKSKERGETGLLKQPEVVKDELKKFGAVDDVGEQTGDQEQPLSEKAPVSPKLGGNMQQSEPEGTTATVAAAAAAEPRNDKIASPAITPPEPRTPSQPTADPLRIYRRCCQLRETSRLKRISGQLAAPRCVAPSAPGMVACLDLSDLYMPLADIITFADWLAIVPVRKLKLENCGLGDEAVRIILGGLLASKANNLHQISPATSGAADGNRKPAGSISHGVIEKLSLKNNPKIGRDGWKHISLFLHMSRSIKAMDLSKIPFPRPLPTSVDTSTGSPKLPDMAEILSAAISQRFAGAHLEELILSECDLSTDDVGKVVRGVSDCRIKRLGLGGNRLTHEGLQHVAQYVRDGGCEGLDLGGNDLHDALPLLARSLGETQPLYALSLADCNLGPASLAELLPALAKLPGFRFIDLSRNRGLFATQPNALGLLRKYLPRLHKLRRIHLEDVALAPDHAIALAEVLPEIPSLAHLSILENELVSALASAKDEAGKEEACALYASLMAALRVSKSIICIDVDLPGPESSEVVKALANQVVAYCLRNMERGPVAEYDSLASTTAPESDNAGVDHLSVVPHELAGLASLVYAGDETAPDEEYVIGGTGVVKALSVCLGNTSHDSRHTGEEKSPVTVNGGDAEQAEATSSKANLSGGGIGAPRAKEMSKNLLGSARKIRARLQPALAKEAKGEDDASYRRLLFLDQTLQRMIQRFEDEFPECRLPPLSSSLVASAASIQPSDDGATTSDDVEAGTKAAAMAAAAAYELAVAGPASEDDDDAHESATRELQVRPPHHGSEVSLALRALAIEEGRMHRYSQHVRREIFLAPSTPDPASVDIGAPTSAPAATINTAATTAEDADNASDSDFSDATTAVAAHTPAIPSARDAAAAATATNDSIADAVATATAAATHGASSTAATATPSAAPGSGSGAASAAAAAAVAATNMQTVRQRIEELCGSELKERLMRVGPDKVLSDLGVTSADLRRLAMLDPESFERLRQAHALAEQNVVVGGDDWTA